MSSLDASRTLLHFLRLFHSSLTASAFSYPPGYPASLSELRDGVYLSRLLHTLDSAHFDLDGLDPSPSSLESAQDNLHQLVVSVETYLEDSASGLGNAVELGGFIDVERMADSDVVRLVEVVLLCAVNSGQREAVIERVMDMGEREQEEVMHSIHSTMQRLHLTPSTQPYTSGTPRQAERRQRRRRQRPSLPLLRTPLLLRTALTPRRLHSQGRSRWR